MVSEADGARDGEALFTQEGGWTMGELTESAEKRGSGFERADFEEAQDKDSQPERRPEKAS